MQQNLQSDTGVTTRKRLRAATSLRAAPESWAAAITLQVAIQEIRQLQETQ